MTNYKFRAWSKDEGFYIDEALAISHVGTLLFLCDIDFEWKYYNDVYGVVVDSFEYFTGRQDSYENDVYQGDILDLTWHDNLYLVVWCEVTYSYKAVEIEGSGLANYFGLHELPDFKVVGNRNENKELLDLGE